MENYICWHTLTIQPLIEEGLILTKQKTKNKAGLFNQNNIFLFQSGFLF
jgi:hypothetical protein